MLVALPERGVPALVGGGDPTVLPTEMLDAPLGTGFKLVTGALEVQTWEIDPVATRAGFDRVLFHTVPRSQRLRVLSLPAAWRDAIDADPPGGSHVGPLSVRATQHERARPAASTMRHREPTLVDRLAPAGDHTDRLDAASERAAADVLTVLSHGLGARARDEVDPVTWDQGHTPRHGREGVLPATMDRVGTTSLATAGAAASIRPDEQGQLALVDPAPCWVLAVGGLRRPRRVSLSSRSSRVDHPSNVTVTAQPAEGSGLVGPW